MNTEKNRASELQVEKWLNTDSPITLAGSTGKVIAIFAFQMLCPGCVANSIPQAKQVHAIFSQDDVLVIGLHTVFEHHEAMTEVSLKAFLYENKVTFPVAIDKPSDDSFQPVPKTMQEYQLRGTPSLLLIDRKGNLRKHKMGHENDLVLGAELMSLIQES